MISETRYKFLQIFFVIYEYLPHDLRRDYFKVWAIIFMNSKENVSIQSKIRIKIWKKTLRYKTCYTPFLMQSGYEVVCTKSAFTPYKKLLCMLVILFME